MHVKPGVQSFLGDALSSSQHDYTPYRQAPSSVDASHRHHTRWPSASLIGIRARHSQTRNCCPFARPAPDAQPLPLANAPPPLRGQAKAFETARGAPHAPNHSDPRPEDRRSALQTSCHVLCGVRPAARCCVQPAPFFRLTRLSELRIPIPAPAAPFALRRRFPPIPLLSLVRPSRARFPSSGSLRLLPLPARPPASARLFLRATSHDLRPCRTARALGEASKQRTSEPSLRVRLRRTRSK